MPGIKEVVENCKPVAKFSCLLFSSAALFAAFGAVSGVVGWKVISAGGWAVQGLDYATFIQAMSIGSAATSVPLDFEIADYILCQGTEKDLKHSLKRGCLYELLCGCCSGFMGTATFNLPYAEQTVYFAVAGGATGNAILVLGGGLLCVLVNAAANKRYLCFKTAAQEIKFVELPTTHQALKEEPVLITPAEAGINVSTEEELVAAANKMPITTEEEKLNPSPTPNSSAPESEEKMDRGLELTIT